MTHINKKKAFLGALLGLAVNHLPAQTNWSADPFDQRVFIENKGQFDTKGGDDQTPVLFGSNIEGTEAYFTAKGVCYRHDRVVLLNEEERDSMLSENPLTRERDQDEPVSSEQERYHFSKTVPDYLKVEWVGCNPQAEVKRSGKVSNYFTYPKDRSVNTETIIANAFDRITYVDLYPGIDLEYYIPRDREGIKYTLVLHPGADLAQVRMRYSCMKDVGLDGAGNISITSGFGGFVDHAPSSFYGDDHTAVKSSFQLDGNMVSFRVADYDHSRTLVIDPWTTNPVFPTWNRAYDVVYDKNGNVWAFGGNYPWQLAKFNSAGVLLWTYSATAMYNSGCCTGSCYGDVTVDENSGSCYLSEGFDWSTGSRIFKVNTSGVQVAASAGNPNFNEIWRMEYSRFTNKIIGTGGGTSCCYQAIVVDTNLTSMNPVNVYSLGPGTDNWGMAVDPVSPYVYLSTTGTLPNPMIKCPIPALLPLSFSSTSGFGFTEIGSVMYVTNGCCANGYNGMAASVNWLFGFNGDTLRKFDKNTGALVSMAVTGGTVYGSGGTAADSCDNIYVGSGTSIMKYDPSLVLLGAQPTAGTVYDCRMSRFYSKLYACGDGFVSEIDVGPCGFMVGAPDEPLHSGFSYYPNPANTQVFFLRDDPSASATRVVLYDLLGHEVAQADFVKSQKAEMNTAGLSSGLYSFGVFDGTKRVQSGKLVIEH